MNVPFNTGSSNLTLFPPHNERTISFGNERLPENFNCKNIHTACVQAYGLIAETFQH